MINLFECSDTGSKVILLDSGEVLRFVVDGEQAAMLNTRQFIEVFRLMNAIWYSQLVHQLNICFGSGCQNIPTGCHERQSNCPALTPYEAKTIVAYNNKMRDMHLEQTRAPIPDGDSSVNS